MATLRALGLAIVMVTVTFAGCATPTDTLSVAVHDSQRPIPASSEEGFVLVEVTGNETRELVSGEEEPQAVCDVAFSHGVDLREQAVIYNGEAYDIDPDQVSLVIATTVWEQYSQCPLHYTLIVDPSEPVQIDLGEGGVLDIQPQQGTAITVEDQRVTPGQTASVSYTYTDATEEGSTYEYTGDLRVDPLGRWPASSLVEQ